MGGRATTPKAARETALAAFAALRARRELHRLSQRQVAAALCVSPQLVAKLEAGHSTGSLAQFLAYCAALDEDPSLVLRQAAGRVPPATAGDDDNKRRNRIVAGLHEAIAWVRKGRP